MLDYITILLLLVTILYAFKLNKKIVSLKDAKEDLSILMHGFDEAIMRAEMSISELKQLSSETSYDFQKKIDKANFLTNDLSFMTDRATELADKLEKTMSLSKISAKNNIQNKKFVNKSNMSFTNSAAIQNNKSEPKKIENNNLQEAFFQNGSSIESLLEKISEIRNNNMFEKKSASEIETTPYKPMVMRQDEFYKSLKKV